jgi:hypothetical protein
MLPLLGWYAATSVVLLLVMNPPATKLQPAAGVTVAQRVKEKVEPVFSPTHTLPSLGWYPRTSDLPSPVNPPATKLQPAAGVTVAQRVKEKVEPVFSPTHTLPSLGW